MMKVISSAVNPFLKVSAGHHSLNFPTDDYRASIDPVDMKLNISECLFMVK